MILGRNAGLWASFVQAGLNVLAAILVVTTGHDLTSAEVALFITLNAFGSVTVGLIANSADPTTAPTFAMTTKAPSPSSSSGATPSPSSGPPTGAGESSPTPVPTGADPSAGDGGGSS